jgi:hypothetical protein
MKILISAFVAASALMAETAPVRASDDHCRYVPRAEWRSMEDAVAAVKSKGYEIREIEVDDGCYEVKAFGKSGERIKLHLDPASLEVVRSRNRS